MSTWETNRVLREIVTSAAHILPNAAGVAKPRWTISSRKSRQKPPVVFNTLVGESSYAFMRLLHAATLALGTWTIPVLSCSLCEPELKLIGSAATVGCITSSAYFESIARPENSAFVARWRPVTATTASPASTAVDICLRHAARPRHPPRRFGGGRRRPPGCGKSSL